MVARGEVAQTVRQMVARLTAGPKADGTAITSQGWGVAPAGTQVELGDKPYALALSPDGKTLLVSNDGYGTQSLMVVDRATGKVTQTIPYKRHKRYISVWRGVPMANTLMRRQGRITRFASMMSRVSSLPSKSPIAVPSPTVNKNADPCPAGLAISPDGKTFMSRIIWAMRFLLLTWRPRQLRPAFLSGATLMRSC